MLGLLCIDIVRSFLRGHGGPGANRHRKSQTRRDCFSSRYLRADPGRTFGIRRKFGVRLEQLRGCRTVSPERDGGWAARYDDLKRYRSMPSLLILDSRVCLGRPSFAAAPVAPPMTPCASRSAASMIAFSR